MKVSDMYKLDAWIKERKQEIQLRQPSQASLAKEASEALDLKVSAASLRDVMVANGIVRKTKVDRELDALREERDSYRRMTIKLIAANQVPDWMREELLAETIVDNEVRQLLQRKHAG